MLLFKYLVASSNLEITNISYFALSLFVELAREVALASLVERMSKILKKIQMDCGNSIVLHC